MRTAAVAPAKVEQLIGRLRLFGAFLGVLAIALGDFPDSARIVLVWSTEGVLVIGTVALWLWRRRSGDTAALMHAGFALDVVVIAGFVLAFAHVTPGVAWAMAFTVLADAAMRYGARGVLLGWVLAMGLFAAHGEIRSATLDRSFGWLPILYVGAALIILAGVLAAFSHLAERQTAVVREQALRLADVQRLRERMVAASSHEFRGSLAAMVLGVDTVRGNVERLSPGRIRAILADVLQQSAHLQRLADDLQAVAQAHNDDISVRVTSADIAETIDLAVAAAARHHKAHRLEIDVPHLVCELDHMRLQQVVRNLVENGFKYTPEGGRVSVSAQHAENVLELRVGDSGPGIPAADRERIFEPFGRRSEDLMNAEGMGLGLYLVRQIVAAMQGSVRLYTSTQGTEFVVRMPAVARPLPG